MTDATSGPGILFAPEAHAALRCGIDHMANLVRPTIGPLGRQVAIAGDGPASSPEIVGDAATILRRTIQIPDPYRNMGAMIVRQAAWQAHQTVGDGAATTALLLQAIVRHAIRYHLATGEDRVALRRGLQRGAKVVVEALQAQARSLEGRDALARFAQTLCQDPEMALLLGEIFDVIGADGNVLVEARHARGLEWQYVEGAHWSEGYLSPYFVTDSNRQEARLEDAVLLLSDVRLTELGQLVPLLEQLDRSNQRNVLIIAQEVSGTALGLLVRNHQAGALRVLAVKAPFTGTHRAEVLEDLAILTGGRVVSHMKGDRVEDVSLEDLGKARLVWANAGAFGIRGGKGDPHQLRKRIAQVKAALVAADETADRAKAEERLGRLLGGVAILKVGADTTIELENRKAAVERAARVLKLALAGGVVPGGGTAYIRCQAALQSLPAPDEERVGLRVLGDALEEPLRAIVSNAGYEPSTIATRVKNRQAEQGFNVRTAQLADMWSEGILDSTEVLQTAVEKAVSAATMVLTTDVLVHHRNPKAVIEP